MLKFVIFKHFNYSFKILNDFRSFFLLWKCIFNNLLCSLCNYVLKINLNRFAYFFNLICLTFLCLNNLKSYWFRIIVHFLFNCHFKLFYNLLTLFWIIRKWIFLSLFFDRSRKRFELHSLMKIVCLFLLKILFSICNCVLNVMPFKKIIVY